MPALLGIALCSPARAAIGPATVIAGPSNGILDVDGTAMAPDGSGGVAFRLEENGHTHVFAAAFTNGRWSAPLRVDGSNPYDASQPTIAAGSDGRLLVAWIQPRNVNSHGVLEYELMSASLQPGASSFGAPTPIDTDVGEASTGDTRAVEPRLAMAPDGIAYVVYRVITYGCEPIDGGGPEEAACHPGTTDKIVQVRVARFDFYKWSSLGAVNREPQIAMLDPTPSNAPSIGIDLYGDGAVVWQEPSSDGVARIWMRRLFGTVPGNVLQVSPATLAGQPVTSGADSPTVAVSPFGEARVAYRILGAPGSAVPISQLFLNSIPSSFDPKGGQLTGSVPIPGADVVGVGQPAVTIEQKGGFQAAWLQQGQARQVVGSNSSVGSPTVLGTGTGQALTTIDPSGGGVTAWLTGAEEAPAVDVREDYPQGSFQQARLAGTTPGAVSGLSLAGSGEGDALLSWLQGPVGQAEIVGDFVPAPPAPFYLNLPSGWVRASAAEISWQASASALAGLRYSIYVDGKLRKKDLAATHIRLSPAGLGDGTHRVQVLALDPAGQQKMSAVGVVKVDANPPIVTLASFDAGRGERVLIRDKASGVDTHAIRISFGDGAHVAGRVRVEHRYHRRGTYTITAQVRDRVGNHAIVHLRVQVR